MEEQKSGSQKMIVSVEETEAVARLARLDLDNEERVEFAEKLSGIIEHIKQLSGLDTEGVGFLSSAGMPRDCLREDEESLAISDRNTFGNAPDEYNGHFRVPRVID